MSFTSIKSCKYTKIKWLFRKIYIFLIFQNELKQLTDEKKAFLVFGQLKNLKFIDLTNNLIEIVNAESFYDLKKIRRLNLSYNMIK